MTDEEQWSFGNGIWLCAACTAEIDKDGSFPAPLLRQWKADAEGEALKKLEDPSSIEERSAWPTVLFAAVSVVRKVALAVALVTVAFVAIQYRQATEPPMPNGIGKQAVGIAMVLIMYCCLVLFLFSAGFMAVVLRKKPSWMHWLADAILFGGWGGLAAFGVTFVGTSR